MGSVLRKCECGTPKCGHPWTVRYREPGGRQGRQREKSFNLKREADAFLAKVESEKNAGVYLDPQRGSVTVQAWADQWLAGQVLARTSARNYETFIRRSLVPALGSRTLASVTGGDIQSFVTTMHRKGLAPGTIRSAMIPLRAMFNAAVRDKRIPESPVRDITLPRASSARIDRDRLPNLDAVARIAAGMIDKYRLTVWLMVGTGLRISEALAVSEDCVRDGHLRVYRQVARKIGDQPSGLVPLKHRAAGDYRDIPLPAFLADEIDQHITTFGTATVGGVDGLLFRTARGALVSVDGTYRPPWNKAAAGTPYTPHDLRHLFASTALAGGVSLVEVSRWLGHQSIAITADTYGHLTEDAPDRMRRVMQDAFRPPLRVIKSA